jgi:hypothetical protein
VAADTVMPAVTWRSGKTGWVPRSTTSARSAQRAEQSQQLTPRLRTTDALAAGRDSLTRRIPEHLLDWLLTSGLGPAAK